MLLIRHADLRYYAREGCCERHSDEMMREKDIDCAVDD